jgi:probable H4MPT-linked C1 transfer pathway protein
MSIVGWDIGGVNTKVAYLDGRALVVRSRPYELQRAPDRLGSLLRELLVECGAPQNARHAVTMTAELSQMFRTKREGVAFVLDAVEHAFPLAPVYVYTVDGAFISPQEARIDPLRVAAANWAATAAAVGRYFPDAILIDIGTTTTDIIPVEHGEPVPVARTDPGRLASGELVYTGVVRTPVEAIASHVTIDGQQTSVAAEGFALSGDVHVWRGALSPEDYSVTAPDGRPATREFAGERLARSVCADREMLNAGSISEIADAFANAQVDRIVEALRRVAARHPAIDTAVVAGLGAFVAMDAASALGLATQSLASAVGHDAARSAPCAAVASLLASADRNMALPR